MCFVCVHREWSLHSRTFLGAVLTMASLPFLKKFFATPLPQECATSSGNLTQNKSALQFRERDACKNGCDCAAAGGYDTCCLPCRLSTGTRHSYRCPVVERKTPCRTCSGMAATSGGFDTCCKFCPRSHSYRCPYRHKTNMFIDQATKRPRHDAGPQQPATSPWLCTLGRSDVFI